MSHLGFWIFLSRESGWCCFRKESNLWHHRTMEPIPLTLQILYMNQETRSSVKKKKSRDFLPSSSCTKLDVIIPWTWVIWTLRIWPVGRRDKESLNKTSTRCQRMRMVSEKQGAWCSVEANAQDRGSFEIYGHLEKWWEWVVPWIPLWVKLTTGGLGTVLSWEQGTQIPHVPTPELSLLTLPLGTWASPGLCVEERHELSAPLVTVSLQCLYNVS